MTQGGPAMTSGALTFKPKKVLKSPPKSKKTCTCTCERTQQKKINVLNALNRAL